MGKLPWQCTTTGLDNSIELRMEKIRQAVTEIWVPQVWQPPARPPARTVTTIPLQPEGLRGKKVWQTDRQMDRKYHSLSCLVTAKNNRAPNLHHFKLCASFQSHRWIQTGVTVRKRPIRTKSVIFFVPCDLEIWRMTLKNYRTPLLYHVKLCASFQSHQWI